MESHGSQGFPGSGITSKVLLEHGAGAHPRVSDPRGLMGPENWHFPQASGGAPAAL